MSKSSVVVFFLVVSCAAVGCAGGGAGEGEGEGEGGATSASDLKAAFDAYLDRCGVQLFGFEAQKEPVLIGILQHEVKTALDGDFDREAADANVTFDAVAGAKCVSELETLSCNTAVGAIDNAAPDCGSAFTGKIQNGSSCADNDECTPASSCHGLDKEHGTCGTCTTKVTLVGGDCSAADCDSGLTCDPNNKQCETTATAPTFHAGDACPNGVCGGDESLVCDATQHCVAVTIVQVGGTCDTSGVNYCIDEGTKNFCDPTSTKCTARPVLNGDCSTIPLCDTTVATCDATSQTCVAAKASGDACTNTSDCAAGLTCSNGHCAAEITVETNPTCN